MKPMRYILVVCLVIFAARILAEEGKEKSSRGLVAHYYRDANKWSGHWPYSVSVPSVDPKDWTFTEYKYSRVEPLVNHLFIRKGWFSVRWVGYIDTSPRERGAKSTKKTCEYTFRILADDGCRLFIDGKKVIDDWRACWEKAPDALRVSKPVILTPGKHRIVVEYFQGQSLERDDKDPMKLYWSCKERGIPRQIVPASHLSHTEKDKTSTGK